MRIRSVLSTLVAGAFLVAVPATAQADDYYWLKDRAGDAPATSDITRFKVTKTDDMLVTKVSFRKVVKPGGERSNPVELYIDTKGNGRPDHRVMIQDVDQSFSKTRSWNGSENDRRWGSCLDDLGERRAVTYQTRAKTVTVRTPLSCLGDPSKVRVAASSWYGSDRHVKQDWAHTKHRYTRWLR
ncbi:DOMON domain-containing protein [Aeromicrobium massiliense]|uniref:hypothetical protein n=1 Tax=Aeromicrobium massiliense TaxID=1464554 RepID=UPI0003119EAA|nr:hypothetical protein [Aeromicrobium massiliense]